MNIQAALLKSMNENHRDATPRLIYADWCEENGRARQAAYYRGDVRLVGRVGRGGLVGLGGRGGLGGAILNPKEQIVLIPGENALVFIPHGYGFAVLLGCVESEHPYGWVVNPAREVVATNNGDNWVALAAGKKPALRKAVTWGEEIVGGVRVPLGAMSIAWQGELPW